MSRKCRVDKKNRGADVECSTKDGKPLRILVFNRFSRETVSLRPTKLIFIRLRWNGWSSLPFFGFWLPTLNVVYILRNCPFWVAIIFEINKKREQRTLPQRCQYRMKPKMTHILIATKWNKNKESFRIVCKKIKVKIQNYSHRLLCCCWHCCNK